MCLLGNVTLLISYFLSHMTFIRLCVVCVCVKCSQCYRLKYNIVICISWAGQQQTHRVLGITITQEDNIAS